MTNSSTSAPQERKRLTYDDLDGELLEALQSVAGGCSQWISGDPRLRKLHEIDEDLLWYREVGRDEWEIHLGSSGRAYLHGLERGVRRREGAVPGSKNREGE